MGVNRRRMRTSRLTSSSAYSAADRGGIELRSLVPAAECNGRRVQQKRTEYLPPFLREGGRSSREGGLEFPPWWWLALAPASIHNQKGARALGAVARAHSLGLNPRVQRYAIFAMFRANDFALKFLEKFGERIGDDQG